MIYLNAEIISGLGEDTFWTWFKREFPSSSFETPKKLGPNDIILRYSTLGFLPIKGKQLAICWELYPNMKEVFSTNQWNKKIEKVYETAKYSTFRTVPTKFSIPHYKDFGSIEIIPIGVDTEVFKPLGNKKELRKQYNLPKNKKIGIWIGTNHPMKGFEELIIYAKNNPDIHWIIISKNSEESVSLNGATNFIKQPQKDISNLMSAADFFLSTSKLTPYYMAEWEAMACNIPFLSIGNNDREFKISENPRDDVFKYGWDRISCKNKWEDFLTNKGIKW